MRGNRARDTKPEIVVRRILSSLGYRYRLHRSDLPGTPDIVFVGAKKVIFVHGCFWHQHSRCRLARPIKSNLSYWRVKLERNKARDRRNLRQLRRLGWDVLVVRECRLESDWVERRLVSFLDGSAAAS